MSTTSSFISIAVASGKGGVGKSTVAVNLAVALAQTGASVGLLDADIYGPNAHLMLGTQQVEPSKIKKFAPARAYGVQVVSMGMLVHPEQAIMWRGPMLHRAIQEFMEEVEWDELDYLIFDLPPGTGDVQLSLGQSSALNGAVIVTLPQTVSQADARRSVAQMEMFEIPVLGIVENMTGDVFGSGGGKQLAEELGLPFLGSIPMSAAIRTGGDAGVPFILSEPTSPAAIAMQAIAQKILIAATAAPVPRSLEIEVVS